VTVAAERHLFRYLGGKGHLVERVAPMIKAHLEATKGKLVSPFYGSGAIEQAVGGTQIAGDLNEDLICFWRQVAWDGSTMLVSVEDFDAMVRCGRPRSRPIYNAVRKLKLHEDHHRAARFLWLQSFCFNGIWRVNKSGGHNVPPDPKRLKQRWPFGGSEAMESVKRRLMGTTLRCSHWHSVIREAKPGDVLLVDPPYGIFDGYTPGGFDRRAHEDLSQQLQRMAEDGVAVVAFNGPENADLYGWAAKVETLKRSGRASSKGSGRAPVGELLITDGLRPAAAERAA
jgi:DNA adenine methylase